MKKEILVEGLNKKEKDDLLKSISDFEEWLLKKKIIDTNPDKIRIVDLPFANADWIMKYDENNKTVSFNTFVQKKCSYDYYKSIVLHEFFHLAVQKVPNKEDAVRIKDDFGNELMKLIDIEADFFTALFYKEHLKFGLVDYLKLYYEGSQAFSDQWIRIGKLERFMGTLLGIIKMFITHVDNISGDINNISGDVSNISGDVSMISGNVSMISGDSPNPSSLTDVDTLTKN